MRWSVVLTSLYLPGLHRRSSCFRARDCRRLQIGAPGDLQRTGHERTLVVLEVDFDLGTAIPHIESAGRAQFRGETYYSVSTVGQRLTIGGEIHRDNCSHYPPSDQRAAS